MISRPEAEVLNLMYGDSPVLPCDLALAAWCRDDDAGERRALKILEGLRTRGLVSRDDDGAYRKTAMGQQAVDGRNWR